MNKKSKFSKKATLWRISEKFLKFRTPNNPEFRKAKWIEFCEHFIHYADLELYLDEAKTTNSKYIILEYKKNNYVSIFKVRYSDHAPNVKREKQKDCDFFVGVSNFQASTTADAIFAVEAWYAKSVEDIAKLI